MTVKFKAVVINNQNEKFTRDIKEIDSSHLKDGNVLVKVDYSSLNYKDALILNDGGKIVRKYPFVPGIDFTGSVVESGDSKFQKDDKVILTGFRVGEAYFGGFSQYAKVDSKFLIKIPVILLKIIFRDLRDYYSGPRRSRRSNLLFIFSLRIWYSSLKFNKDLNI